MRHRTALVIAALVTLLVSGFVSAEQLTSSEKAGQKAYREGRFGAAVQLFTTALAETEDPEHRGRLHIRIAWTQFALGRHEDAATHLKAALVENPGLTLVPDYYTQEFLDLFSRCRQEVARGPEPETGVVPPPDLEATVAAARSRLDDGRDLEGALADVEQLMVAYPDDDRLPSLYEELKRRLGVDTDESGPEPASVLERMAVPDLILQGNSALTRGDVDNAMELLHEAVTRQPNNIAALELLAETAQRAQEWDEAEFALKTALSLQPDNLELSLRLGEVFLARGDASAARDVFRRITSDAPHADRAWAALGLIDAQLGKRDEALAALTRAVSENPLLPEVQLALGELHLLTGNPQAALDALHTAANLLPADPQVEARTGQALLARKQPGAALSHLIAAVEGGFAPDDVRAALALARIAAGRLAEAERQMTDLADTAGDDALVVQGVLRLEQSRPGDALRSLHELGEKRPNDGAVLNLVGVALYRLGRFEDAAEMFDRALGLMSNAEVVNANLSLAKTAVDALRLGASATDLKPRTSNAVQ